MMNENTLQDFSIIPYRVVIFHILPFHDIDALLEEDDVRSEFEYYGYFRNDPFRNIFFLFRTISIKEVFFKKYLKIVDLPSRVSVSKIENFEVCIRDFHTLGRGQIMDLKISEMKSLTSFTLRSPFYQDEEHEIGKGIFYPHIRKLHIEVDFDVDARRWNRFDFSQVETLKLTGSKYKFLNLDDENLFGLKSLKNLKHFVLKGFKLRKKTIFNLPSLLSLKLSDQKNVSINHGGKITKMSLRGCEEELCKKLILDSPRVLDLRYHLEEKTPAEYLFDGPLRKYWNIFLRNITFPSQDEDYELFHPEIRKLQLLRCECDSNFISSIFQSPEKHPKLINLRFYVISLRDEQQQNHNLSFLNCPLFSQLLVLELSSCEFITDELFQKNEFTLLSEMDLSSLSLTGKNWSTFPSLKILTMCILDHLEDYFFEDSETRFPALEYMEIEQCPKLKGKDWGVFPKLKKVRFYWIDIGDEVFQGVNHFPSLKKMYMRMCHKIVGVDWNTGFTKGLRKMTLAKCGSFSGHVFYAEPDSFSSLEVLSLYRVHALDEKEWIGIRNLLELSCDECSISDAQFQGESMKNLLVLDFCMCFSVKGENWSYLPRLERFVYSRGPLDFKGKKPYGESTKESIHV